MTTEVYLSVYCPGPVTACLTTGSGSFIGIVNDTTVLKYPHTPGDTAAFSRLQSEARMLQAIGSHQNIIGFKGLISEGLLLERASLGSVTEYLSTCNPASWQRLLWIYQVADALSRVHEKGVIHRDISTNNLLLDENLNIKLCDFQGRLVSLNGDILE